MTNLEDKVALITGGARRIGAATARALHAHGMRLVIHYRSSPWNAEVLCKELCAVRPDSVHLIRCDLNDIPKLRLLVRESVATLGRLDVLVNNAAQFFPTPLHSASEDQWDMLMNINLKAPFFLAQAVAPYLAREGGCIINITDIYADRPLEDHPIYNITKSGLVALTHSLARDLGPEVRVNAIAPGAILWPENDAPDELSKHRLISRTPLRKAGEVADITRTILFLIDGAPYITGQVIRVDGGRSVVS